MSYPQHRYVSQKIFFLNVTIVVGIQHFYMTDCLNFNCNPQNYFTLHDIAPPCLSLKIWLWMYWCYKQEENVIIIKRQSKDKDITNINHRIYFA